MTAVAARRWGVAALFTAMILATRLPLAPHQLFTFDDVNLAYSIGHFDIRISQPQPPGYPVFVMEMRALAWLRFHRVENILLTLAISGSIAALLLMVYAGDRIFGRHAGLYAALLFVLNPVFWHSGVASALRIQLAIASLAVGATCWGAWQGNCFQAARSAIVLGLVAGIRPEIGPLLFPLWAVSAWRARLKWEDLRFALGAMTLAVLAWLAPTMWASGGPAGYVKACLDYLNDQASITSSLFGSDHAHTTLWHLVVWTLAMGPALLLAAVIAFSGRRSRSDEGDSGRLAFLALWFGPPFVFACFVHLEDPGQALGMTVVVALFGGYLIQRAVDRMEHRIAGWHVVLIVAGAIAADWLLERREAMAVALWLAALAAAVGLAVRVQPWKKHAGAAPLAMTLLLPAIAWNLNMFHHRGWYYRGAGWAGEALEDINSGLALTSLEHIRNTLAVDDRAIRDVRRLAAERPGQTLVVWEHGPATWRKLAYYAPSVPVAVLEHQHIRSGPPVIALWKGSHRSTVHRVDAAAGSRIVWVINPRTEFYGLVQRSLAPQPSGSVLYTDLPAQSGSRMLGEYELVW